MIDLDRFIREQITGRERSLFADDIESNKKNLSKELRDKRVLVIGGAGTIGKAFIKSAVRFRPAAIVVIDQSENGLAELIRDLRSSYKLKLPETLKTYPVSYSSLEFEHILKAQGPFHIVTHFAAHKHVRTEKDVYSIAAMLRNNVLDMRVLLDRLSQDPPEHFFGISTDKATDPVNVMGASKKLMEDLIMSYSGRFPVTTARFANVAFSNGSLPDAFLRRLENRQPLAAPRDVHRYFISPEESGHICLISGLLGRSGELFFPKLSRDSTMRFDQIARRLLDELGWKPELCANEEEAREYAAQFRPEDIRYPVYFFDTDTTGEKEMETFHRADDLVELDRFDALGVMRPSLAFDADELQTILRELSDLLQDIPSDKSVLIDRLEDWIPHFNHFDTGKSLDDRM